MPSGTGQESDEQTHPDAAGSTVAEPGKQSFRIGRYTVLSSLGHGAMGMVYAAYDDKLDRKVALKVLHSLQETGTEGQARLVREAQALARVSHPNVVQVYEVGEHDGEVFLAMEFVRGETLRRWTRARDRGWREVLSVYLQAGRGLAAAHEVGLVHRDFKPDNVMIGDDGRVRVMDFGLARAIARPDLDRRADAGSGSDAGLSLTLTVDGKVVGTPAYMAPEQVQGGDVGAHADQFAFCVALFEALYGQRPFAGNDLRAHLANITSGTIREPPRRSVPRWLRQIVIRGLAAAPAQRWPGMKALLARIERGQALSRLRVLGASLAAALLLGVGVWGGYQADLSRRTAACNAAGAEIDAVWGDAARAQVREAFLKTGAGDAADTAERVMPWLDRQAASWSQARSEACMDADLRNLWTADMLDRSLWCLDERRMELESLVAEFTRADKAVLQKAVPAAAGLDQVATCRDAATLARLPSPPAERRDEARAVRAELARSSTLLAAGRLDDAVTAAQTARTRADALAWPPLAAASQYRVGVTLNAKGKYAEAEHELEEAGFAAMKAGALGVAADAAAALVILVGQKLARFDDGLRWARFAELAAHKLEPTPGLRAAGNLIGVAVVRSLQGELPEVKALQERALALQIEALGPEHLHVASSLQNLALTLMKIGAFDEALAMNGRALALREAALGPEHSEVGRTLTVRASILRNLGRYPEALVLAQRALATMERNLGPEHPELGVFVTNLANLYLVMGRNDQVEALQRRGLAIREKAFGPEHPEVAASLNNLGAFYLASRSFAAAYPLHLRALAIREKVFGPEHREVATSLTNLALCESNLDKTDAALAHHRRALEIFEKVLGPDHPDTVAPHTSLGQLAFKVGDFAEAKRQQDRALAIIEKAMDPRHPAIIAPLITLADVALATRRPAEAIPLLERAAAALAGQEPDAIELADVQFTLARALWDAPAAAGRDRKRALEQARAARTTLKSSPDAASSLAEIERWLAKHTG
jgi:tetratricopeptide (TPR) repeat protein/predicted Ser/Thr protein kinase